MPSSNNSQVPGHGEQLGGSIVHVLLGSIWHLLQTAVRDRPIRMQRLPGVREAWQDGSTGGSKMVAQLLTAPFDGLAFILSIPVVGILAVPAAIFVRLYDLKK
jgi:hypothetical protein